MNTKPLILCVTAAIVSAVRGCPVGREFLTTFLTNYDKGDANLELAITAYEKTATVNVWSPIFNQKITVAKGSTEMITLPPNAELKDPGLSNKIVHISSDNDITVVASNMKYTTGDSAVVLPTSNLGRKYVVFTPHPKKFLALVAIVNGDRNNTVEILPPDNMVVNEDENWNQGGKITHTLKPYEVYQFMSNKTFTGTRITSTFPLAVLVGDQCAIIHESCDHVYEQLIPVERLSNHYLVPGILRAEGNVRDSAYVVAVDDDTTVTVSVSGKQETTYQLDAGKDLDIRLGKEQSVIVKSNKKVMVMYFGSNHPFDEFLTNIIPTTEMSNSWTVYTRKTFRNMAVIVSEAEGSNTISGVTGWRSFPSDNGYVWTMKILGSAGRPVTISGEALMAVYSIGGKWVQGYGTTGVCASDPCKAKNCREKEKCVKNGSSVQCVAESNATCWAMGDPHYKSFDGKLFSYQGSCTYTLVQTTGPDETLTPFSIVIKTEMENKQRGAYLKTVTINMEGVKIVVVYGDPGQVLVDGTTSKLPVTLKSGRIRITQESYKGFLKTNFGVEIIFDWGETLYVTVPSSYYKNLEGVCGTYNGNEADDFSMPDGTTIASLENWVEAWSFPEANSSCLHSCQDQCPNCTAEDESLYKGKKYCGEIGEKNGAFAACNAKVPSEKLLADCLYNMCIHEGDKEMLCKIMANYSKICQLNGAEVSKQWLQTLNC